MRKFTILFCVLSLFTAVSCQKEVTGDYDFQLDVDAKRFIEAAHISVEKERLAVDQFVVEMKKAGLWGKFDAIYPMLGGTLQSIRWNLKDPRDVKEAFYLTIFGDPVVSETGVIFPTVEDYASTNLSDSLMRFNDNHISYYSRTQNTVSGYDMGCHDNLKPYNQMTIYHGSNATDYFGFFLHAYKPESTKGLFMISATTDNAVWYTNGEMKFERGRTPKPGSTGYPMLIGWCQNAASGGQRECALATIGKGLTTSEATRFYEIVQGFQHSLDRAVD